MTMSREAIRVSVLPLVLLVMAPDTVMSLSAVTVCKVVAPLRLLALTVKALAVFKVTSLLVMVTLETVLPVLTAVTSAPLTKLTVLVLAEITPLAVMAPVPPNAALAATVMAPVAVAAVLLVLIKAPLPLNPAPLSVMALAMEEPFKSRVAAGRTLTMPVPNGPAAPLPVSTEPALSTPCKICVPPE